MSLTLRGRSSPTAHVLAQARAQEGIAETPQSMGGEDFSWYLEHVPGALARLGVGRVGPNVDLHRASFDVDERTIEVGVRLLVQTALRSLSAA